MDLQASAFLPTMWGDFEMKAYADQADDLMPHVALVHREMNPSEPVYVRIHSECMTGDIFGSLKCDCGDQLKKSMEVLAEQRGVLLYLRQEGRGIGLINKLKAYRLQQDGLDTIEANVHLGLEIDARQYEMAITILRDLGIQKIRLLTNNPLKIEAFEGSGIQIVDRVPLIIDAQPQSAHYLEVKADKMGHLLK